MTNFQKSNFFCVTHFKESDIISKWESGQVYSKYMVIIKSLLLNTILILSYLLFLVYNGFIFDTIFNFGVK